VTVNSLYGETGNAAASHFLQELQGMKDIFSVSTTVVNGQWVWRWHEQGYFTVKSAYSFLSHSGILTDISLWKICVPGKVKIFLWLLKQNSILTQHNLLKRGWPHLSTCVMCKLKIIETSNHMFLTCTVERSIWAPRTPQQESTPCQHWYTTRTQLLSESDHKTWDCECMATFWNIWKERNRRIFQSKELPVQGIINLIQGDAYTWKENG
jgi:zinc-binding in reverse transcriptase